MGLVYYGISLNIGSFGGNIYVTYMISGVIDLVSGLASLWVLKKYGRYESYYDIQPHFFGYIA